MTAFVIASSTVESPVDVQCGPVDDVVIGLPLKVKGTSVGSLCLA